jgi:hypothetical protein
VKTSLAHLIGNSYEQLQRQPRALNPRHPDPADERPATTELDPVFLASWRDELLTRPFVSAIRRRDEK